MSILLEFQFHLTEYFVIILFVQNIGEHSNSASSHPTTPSPGPNNNPIRTVALVKKRKKAAIRIPKSVC